MRLFGLILFLGLFFSACTNPEGQKNGGAETADTTEITEMVNVYTHRHYDSDKMLFEEFTEKTGIKVNVLRAKADELINRLEQEGASSPADLLIAVDAGRLHRAKEKGLLQPVQSDVLKNNIPADFSDPEGHWYALTYRARIVVYSKDRVDSSQLSTYDDLTSDKWRGKLLVRSAENEYNQSLMASVIAHKEEEGAKEWAEGIVKNMAREPKGNDRDQVKAIAAGLGDLALVNTYYIGNMLNSEDEQEKLAGSKVGVFFPEHENGGTHINISGAGVTAHSPNKENAVKLLEFLSGEYAQKVFAEGNFEYPVKPAVEWHPLLKEWGDFKKDTIDLTLLGKYHKDAVLLFNEAGWK